jgi:thioredoxin-related protein
MNRLNKIINVAIVLVIILIGVVFTSKYLLHRNAAEGKDYRVAAGTKVYLPGMDWTQNEKTLLLVLQKGCRYCKQSAPFYQRLVKETATNRTIRLVAVLPQDVADGTQYLKELDVPISEVRQAALETLKVQGTPTLILVNSKGEVVESWAGKLPSDTETEVLKRLGQYDR